MCNTGVGMLAFIDGNLNSQKYIKTLDHYLWPTIVKRFSNNNWIFQEDNVPAHKSWEATVWKEINNTPVSFWPAQSPNHSLFKSLCLK